MRFKATTGWAISGWLLTIILLVIMAINSFDASDSINTLLGKIVYPLVGESSRGLSVFLIIIIGIAVLSVGFIGGIFVSVIKHTNHLTKFNGLYVLKNTLDAEEVLHIIYIWNKPAFILSGYKEKMIYRQYHQSSSHKVKKRIDTFLYGLTCPVDANGSNNANCAALYGEENGLRLLIELKNNCNDNIHPKISLNIFEEEQSVHILEGKSEKKETTGLSSLQDDGFQTRFEQIVAKIIADEWESPPDSLPGAIRMRPTTANSSQEGGA